MVRSPRLAHRIFLAVDLEEKLGTINRRGDLYGRRLRISVGGLPGPPGHASFHEQQSFELQAKSLYDQQILREGPL